MLSKLKKSDNKGFTIIEVMIVLAIAGLILLIVFLAVPALQRSSRNTSRKSDAGRVSAAVSDYVSNNQGKLPGLNAAGTLVAANWNTDCLTILKSAGTLSQFSGVACVATLANTGTANKFVAFKGAIGADPFTAFANGQDGMLLDEQAQCINATSTSPGTTRQAALFYTTENGGVPTTVCLNAE
jgi:prepilin-type N-terminal cleavage/methylation domain-containing protein